MKGRSLHATMFVALIAVAFVLSYMVTTSQAEDCQYTYDNFGKEFVGKYCASCHVAAKKGFARKGAPADVNYDTLEEIVKGKAHFIEEVVEKKKMPPKDPKPSDEERGKVKTWLDCEKAS